METGEMVQAFPSPQLIKAIANGRAVMPRDPQERAIYQDQLARYKAKQANKSAGDTTAAPEMDADMGEARMKARQDTEELASLAPAERFARILSMDADERIAFGRALRGGDRERILEGMTPEQREQLMALANPQQVIVAELSQAKVLRAAYSERQLEEVMTDFWFNHFNIFINKGADRYLITSYERDVIRPRALGKFQDLLMATAKSPAMLFYLDNWQSLGPDSMAGENGGRFRRNARFNRRLPQQQTDATQQQQQPKRGLNENYARELMELQTLGVDGGYTQKDVTEVAKIFTGWTIKDPRTGGGYQFEERRHEPGTKYVLGKKFSEDGEGEGKKLLEMLAHHPATAHFVSKKLAMRFVSDDPPAALVDRMADTFLKKDGDIREVLRTMFRSPEFWAPEAYRAKVKTPLEFVVSAVRATGADVSDAQPLVGLLNKMGMPLYGMQPPTGYSMKAETWVNSSALINRMNFALAIGSGKLRGISLDTTAVLSEAQPSDPDTAIARLSDSLLGGDVSSQTQVTIRKQFDDPGVNPSGSYEITPQKLGLIAGLLMGSPEFQRR
jgi:uncharacterized protein (DUF1800 family)